MRWQRHEILFGVAIVLLAALAAWWTMFIVRSVRSERDSALQMAELNWEVMSLREGMTSQDMASCPAPENDRAEIEERYRRRMLMIMGEGALMFLLLGVCLMMLMRIARQERRQLRAMESFISLITHEMKTPLAGIKSLLQTSVAGAVPPERSSELMVMGLAEAERLEHMIENVLLAGRLRADRQPVTMTRVGVAALLREFVEHRSEILTDRNRLVLDLEGDEQGLEAVVDTDGLRVILENLVDNAFKYGGDDPVVRIGVRASRDSVIVQVTDEGIGVASEDLERIFEPFHRTVSEKSTVRHGTGLGLSIARALARRMGGDVTAHSDGPGRGTRFDVVLPGRPA